MCGRFALNTHPETLVDLFPLATPLDFEPLFNIAPTDTVPIFLGTGQLIGARWGLLTPWARSPRDGAKLINVRSETAATKRSFASAFRSRRCLVPATAYYEWITDNGRKLPHLISQPDEACFTLAGLWSTWTHRSTGETLTSFTLLTTQASPELAELHPRMPVWVSPQDRRRWLDTSQDAVLDLLRPAPHGTFTHRPCSTAVNNVRNKGHEVQDHRAPVPGT